LTNGPYHWYELFTESYLAKDSENHFSVQGLKLYDSCAYVYLLLFADGDFLVAVSSGGVSLPVQCYRVSVKKVDDKCQITSQALPSFFLQCMAPGETSCKCYIKYTIIKLISFIFAKFHFLKLQQQPEPENIVEMGKDGKTPSR